VGIICRVISTSQLTISSLGDTIPPDPWIIARQRYLQDLSAEQAKLFATATPENVLEGAITAQTQHEQGSKSRAWTKKLRPLVDAVEQYGLALGVSSNAAPTIMGPVWGSLRVVLLVGLFYHLLAEGGALINLACW